MNHVMIDIETMGTSSEAAIVAIGAVLFDPETQQLGATYYAKVLLADAVAKGGKIDADTVLWWLKQDDEARKEITGEGRTEIEIALAGLYVFIEDNTDPGALQVWANGASFDLPILTSAFTRLGYKPAPWKFYQERCFRTLKNLRPDIKSEPLPGNVKHNALDDAKAQALHAIALLRAIAPQQRAEPVGYVSSWRDVDGDWHVSAFFDGAPPPSGTKLYTAPPDPDALRDMLDDARSQLDFLREALGVSYEPHQSLFERMVEAAQAKASPQQAKREEPVVTVSFDVEGFDKMREDLAALPPGTQLFAEVRP